MSDTRQLLEFIYKNAQMGIQTLPKLIEKADNPQLIDNMTRQLAEYEEIVKTADTLIKNDDDYDNKALGGLSKLEKLTTDTMLSINTMKDVSSGHIADMLIKGSSMGIKDISEHMRGNAGADTETLQLAEKLRQTQQTNIDEMQNFLSLT